MSKSVLAGTAFICLSVFLASIALYPGATGSDVSEAMASCVLANNDAPSCTLSSN
ncbi:MAG: hypothetical protein HOI91_02225 [Halieaceae bacterium]|nr:hypothetical protein [Halieaceae bacterium]